MGSGGGIVGPGSAAVTLRVDEIVVGCPWTADSRGADLSGAATAEELLADGDAAVEEGEALVEEVGFFTEGVASEFFELEDVVEPIAVGEGALGDALLVVAGGGGGGGGGEATIDGVG